MLKPLSIALAIAALASLEFFHEHAGGFASGVAACFSPDTQHEAMRELLVQHLKSH